MTHIIERKPPADIDAEQTVLACCASDAVAIAKASAILEKGDFYRYANRLIWEAILELWRADVPVDLITLRDQLGGRLDDAGGMSYLVDVVGSVPTTAFVTSYAAIVKEKARRRALIAEFKAGLDDLFDPDVQDAHLKAVGRVMAVEVTSKDDDRVRALPEVVAEEHERVAQKFDDRQAGKPVDNRRVLTGIEVVDKAVIIDTGDMVVIGARPSAGKTAFGVQVARFNAERGLRVLMFSLEMTRAALARRYLTERTRVSAHRQITGYVSEAELRAMSDAVAHAFDHLGTFEIDDRPGLTVSQMHAAVIRRQQEAGLPFDLLVIDHLIKVRSALKAEATGHARLSQVSNDVKALGRTLGVPIIALTQLRRPAQGQEDKKPAMGDLRESGSVEEDADVIGLLHRPDREGTVTPATVDWVKQRNGPVGETELVYDCSRMTFKALEANLGGTL